MKKNYRAFVDRFLLPCFFVLLMACQQNHQALPVSVLKVSENHRFFSDESGKPFFWLGDTGWLLFSKLSREDALKYLDNRSQKGFNVIQVMVLHCLDAVNFYGDSALVNKDVAHPYLTEGDDFRKSDEYDYWDHIDFVVAEAAKRDIYMALVPVWGSNVKAGKVNIEQAEIYACFLANRFKNVANIVWLNGGDTKGDAALDLWNTIGNTLKKMAPNHLISFHPFGRMQSSMWFHNENWLDFNMFQSGHRRYDQDDSKRGYAQDNWKYVRDNYLRSPAKPVIDGEPSYEGIPQGLHDPSEPYWNENDARRYAYWSVFAGACGHTYGNNAVMQFYSKSDSVPAYGAKKYWTEAINDPGAGQMVFLKRLILSRPFFERIPDQSMIAGAPGTKYDFQIATRGNAYAFIYSYKAKKIKVAMGKIKGTEVKASWYNPRNGEITELENYSNKGICEFNPPGEPTEGNDWVLILDSLM